MMRLATVPEKSCYPRGAAFTLIELLVVLAVIAVLASLLLPGISRARAAAQSASCKSNLRQIGVALRLYVDEYEKYPPRFSPTNHLLPFCGGKYALFHCPGTKRDAWRSYLYNDNSDTRRNTEDGFPLALTDERFEREAMDWITIFVPESRVLVPSDMLAVGELWGFGWPSGLYYASSKDFLPVPYGNPHGQNLNAVFCDGHVESGDWNRIPKEIDPIISKAFPELGNHLRFKPDEALARRWNNDHEPHPETWPR
jgi:prepilin-type N-terminal cleavage/methylation domain-containing protein/prepilin-type processing-associated H-X9-DG protein